jgi:N-acetylglucosaminyldiphosphoundecaprenol N-acetyl-beta-D-mannosaminyltransferase
MMHKNRFYLWGLPVDPLERDELISVIQDCVSSRRNITLASINMHGIYHAFRNNEMNILWKKPDTLVHIDGMPIVWLSKLGGQRVNRRSRVGHIDLMPALFKSLAQSGRRVMYVGSREDTLEAGVNRIQELAPGLQIRCYHGFFDLDDRRAGSHQAAILEAMREWKPDVLLVGMGMPRQEVWINRIRGEIDVPVVIPCGGFFDLMSGSQRVVPRWIGQIGMEWLYRLICSPRRLFFRYCIEPFWIAGYVLLRNPKHQEAPGISQSSSEQR